MSENKTGKYLKYAIGEIILVMIGILLALQVNNWNDNRKTAAKQQVYLKSLIEDMKLSKVALNRVINKSDRVAINIDSLISIIKLYSKEVSNFQIDTMANKSLGYTVFIPSEGVINDILSSGQLELINNAYLRTEIASWQANLGFMKEFEKLSKESVTKLQERLTLYMDYANLKFSDTCFIEQKRDAFMSDIILHNNFESVYGSSITLNELYKAKMKHIDTLIQVLESETIKK